MITKAKESPVRAPGLTATAVHDALAIGSTIKQNIVEKLPVINTQVIEHHFFRLRDLHRSVFNRPHH